MHQMQTGSPDSAELASALAAGVETAFADLVRATQDDVFSGALRLTGNRADAEDVTQETYVRAFHALMHYTTGRIEALRLRGWLWTIAANLCRNRARSRARHPQTELPGTLQDAGGGPEQHAVAADERSLLADHVSMLPWQMRLAVVLRHVVGLTYAEIADALDRPVGTVKADVHRGLARLRQTLEEAQWTTD
jgi:RNA polymerase sigma factor (sigma-70 family)